jgi:drug/metabolite transporter (DMT)-like permease
LLVQRWLPTALALLVWALQRLLSKVALATLGTRKFYLLGAVVSLLTYAPYLVLRPPATGALLSAFGLACLMALTFGITTEAIRRGPLGAVSPITAVSPALAAVLGTSALDERLAWPSYLGLVLAVIGVVLLGTGGTQDDGRAGWLWLALLSPTLQGVGALVAKLVVTPAGPSALLLASAVVAWIPRRSPRSSQQHQPWLVCH